MNKLPSATTIFMRGMVGRCPHCGVGSIFRGLYAVNHTCPNCNLAFDDRPGDFTGAAYINSGLSGLIVVLFGLLAVLFTDLSVPVLVMIAIPLTITVATFFHRPIRGGWVALMYYTEAITPPSSR